jgi:hypothetical protein
MKYATNVEAPDDNFRYLEVGQMTPRERLARWSHRCFSGAVLLCVGAALAFVEGIESDSACVLFVALILAGLGMAFGAAEDAAQHDDEGAK